MKTAVVLMLSMAAVSCAQDRKAENKPNQNAEKKRLESVTWDLTNHKLIWVIQTGTEQGGAFVANRSDTYEILPDKAVMSFANEKRGFTQEEAASLHKLLDTLSLYCAESVIWWDQGEGDRLDGMEERRRTPHTRPRQRTPAPAPKHRVEQVEPGTPPERVHSTLVARTLR
jgi:hypothetical protein